MNTEQHPASEAPQMVMDTGNAEAPYRLETEPERIARIQKSLARAEAPKPKVSPAYAPQNGDRVTTGGRKATIIGVDGENAYVRYAETRTQARVPISGLHFLNPGQPEAPLVDPANQVKPEYGGTQQEAAADEGDWACEHTLAKAEVRGEFPTKARPIEASFPGVILAELEAVAPPLDMRTIGNIDVTKLAVAPLPVAIRRTHPAATIPTQARHGDAGYDLTASEGGMVYPGSRMLVGTGIEVAIPLGYVGLIMPRSGLAHKSGVAILGGVIDAGYRGEVKVILLNTDHDRTFGWAVGDRIAQLVIQPVAAVAFRETDTLPSSERSAGGFGSTGA